MTTLNNLISKENPWKGFGEVGVLDIENDGRMEAAIRILQPQSRDNINAYLKYIRQQMYRFDVTIRHLSVSFTMNEND